MLTPEQRQAALAHLATVSDGKLASMTWQAIPYGHELAMPKLVREVAAAHCDAVIRASLDTLATHTDPVVRLQAQSNAEHYTKSAERLTLTEKDELEVEVNAELVGAGS